MNLPSDFDKATRRVEMLAHRVVHHRLDHREGHAFTAKIVQCVFDELATDTATLRGLINREIRNATLLGFPIETRRDVADNLAIDFGDENSFGLAATSSSTWRPFR